MQPMLLRICTTLLVMASPLAVLATMPPSQYARCMTQSRAARNMTLEQHYESGAWHRDDQLCSTP